GRLSAEDARREPRAPWRSAGAEGVEQVGLVIDPIQVVHPGGDLFDAPAERVVRITARALLGTELKQRWEHSFELAAHAWGLGRGVRYPLLDLVPVLIEGH